MLTLAGEPGALGEALPAAASVAIERVDLVTHQGVHPRIGVLDVCPVVFSLPEQRESARHLAADLAADLASRGLPVFLYGDLATAEQRRERHFFRRGGLTALIERMGSGELTPDLGPGRPHPSAGAVLITARPPLAAFNLELSGASIGGAREIAARIRESGGGRSGVRAIAIDLGGGRTQISTNVHDPIAVPLADVIADLELLAPAAGATVEAAELIGLIPEAALRDYPERVPIRDFDPAAMTIEARLDAIT